MSLESLFKGQSAQVFNRHPNGKFDALISEITIAKTQDEKRQYLKFSLITVEGKAPDFKIFLVNENDAFIAENNAEVREKIIKSIRINKGLIVRLELASEESVKEWGQPEMIKAFASLKGQKVEITIDDDKKDPRYQVVYLDKRIVSGASSITPAQQIISAGQKAAEKVNNFSLDDIPF